jgi:hypothetical protein
MVASMVIIVIFLAVTVLIFLGRLVEVCHRRHRNQVFLRVGKNIRTPPARRSTDGRRSLEWKGSGFPVNF